MPETAPDSATATTVSSAKTYRHIPIAGLSAEELGQLSSDMKLSLSREDMSAVQEIFADWNREPTDVELEVIAQTWSEHCKHRIFGAHIEHTVNGEMEVVDSLFKTYIKELSERIFDRKPGFVLSAFHDNAGFINVDDERAICLKVETHNHPSAIEPYAGANTGLGGVIRDILGAGKGAKPIASLDVFCFGAPDTAPEKILAEDVIHPLGVLRGVVRGVRDYGNRMGIPTVSGAIQFDETYIYNPLVFCGTAGVIPKGDIDKTMSPGLKVIAVGGRTGRDGLHGATFSSAALDTESHEEDQQAVQIGNPIEEKKAADFVLAARELGLIEFLTDCGAGGFSSAAGEMLSETGGEIFLERAPLKEPGLVSWEIFISESQERMVLAVKEEALPKLRELSEIYESELTELGHSDDSGILKVWHDGELVCELDCKRLHEAPTRHLQSNFETPYRDAGDVGSIDLNDALQGVMGDFAIVSREPIIREYDHEVQGNTFLKPLAGATGDAPQDGAVMKLDGSDQLMAMGQALLPEWGKYDPFAMGSACVDECFRQLVLTGADPDRIALLDNFCVGNPEDPTELGALVECVKGMAGAADAYSAPFVSGKDSFYNYFETAEGPVSIPTTLLVSGMGVVEDKAHVTGSSLRRADSVICVVGKTGAKLGGSVLARRLGIEAAVPATNCEAALESYRAYYEAVKAGLILSAHDCSEGGLATTLAEMAFSEVAGLEISLDELPVCDKAGAPGKAAQLFAETPSRIVFEVAADNLDAVREKFSAQAEAGAFGVIGRSTGEHASLRVEWGKETLIDLPVAELKSSWKNGLTPYY